MKIDREIRKILVLNLGGIGDILLSAPALQALRKAYPQAYIALLAVPRVCEVAKNLKLFNEIVVFDAYDEKARRLSLKKFIKFLNVLLILRRQQYDLTVNMRTIVSRLSALKMSFLFYAIGSRYRAGRDTCGRGFFLNIKIPESDFGDKHETEYDLETVEALGADISGVFLNSDIFGADETKMADSFEKFGVVAEDMVIAVNPGGEFSRRWPFENFIKVIDRLISELNCKVVVIGGASERELSAQLERHFGSRIIDTIGKISISELAVLLKRCSLLITNDTGPMHIAAILKVPLVAIFGGGHIARFDPRKIFDKAVVLYKKADCAPCNRVECASMKCLKEIAPEEVVEAALDLLEEK